MSALAVFGLVMSFGIVGRYIVGARWPTGDMFLHSITLSFACPWTLSTAVMLIGGVGMIAIGGAYATLGRATPDARAAGVGSAARTICFWALIAIFATGYADFFVIDRIWPSFYYSRVTEGKNVWLLLLQLACVLAYMVGVMIAAGDVKRLCRAAA